MNVKKPFQQNLSLGLSVLLLFGSLTIADPALAKKKDKPAEPNGKTEVSQPQATPQMTIGEEAREVYNQGVELFQVGQIQAEKGNKRGQQKLLEEAIHKFETALTKDAQLVEAQSNIGFAYLTMEEHRNAVKAFNKALAINDKHLNSLNGLSTAYAFDGKIEESIRAYDRLTQLDPANPQYFFNKGSVLHKAGRLNEAKEAYQEALRIDPAYQRALFNMGTLLENRGELSAALPFYEKAKGSEIGNTIGLEAIRRIEAIQSALGSSENKPESGASAPKDKE